MSEQFREMSNETSMKHLTEMYGQTLAGIKLLLPQMSGKAIGRIVEVYAGLPFVSPTKTPQSENERVLLQGLIKLADLRISMLELVGEEGEVIKDDKVNEPKAT